MPRDLRRPPLPKCTTETASLQSHAAFPTHQCARPSHARGRVWPQPPSRVLFGRSGPRPYNNKPVETRQFRPHGVLAGHHLVEKMSTSTRTYRRSSSLARKRGRTSEGSLHLPNRRAVFGPIAAESRQDLLKFAHPFERFDRRFGLLGEPTARDAPSAAHRTEGRGRTARPRSPIAATARGAA